MCAESWKDLPEVLNPPLNGLHFANLFKFQLTFFSKISL
jgi:hypothetical protein